MLLCDLIFGPVLSLGCEDPLDSAGPSMLLSDPKVTRRIPLRCSAFDERLQKKKPQFESLPKTVLTPSRGKKVPGEIHSLYAEDGQGRDGAVAVGKEHAPPRLALRPNAVCAGGPYFLLLQRTHQVLTQPDFIWLMTPAVKTLDGFRLCRYDGGVIREL